MHTNTTMSFHIDEADSFRVFSLKTGGLGLSGTDSNGNDLSTSWGVYLAPCRQHLEALQKAVKLMEEALCSLAQSSDSSAASVSA